MLMLIAHYSLKAQEEVRVQTKGVELFGTLLVPEKETKKAILFISGSGATDRNGNTKPTYSNDALKKLAEELTALGFATLRYDKRGVGRSVSDSIRAEDLRFEQYAEDAAVWLSFLRKKYSEITIIGHSQGALVGMMATQKSRADKFISLAGLSEDAYTTVKRQLSNQPAFVVDAAYLILDSLKLGVKVAVIPPFLNSLFNPKTQDYFISFMKYDPRVEIKKMNCPILVVQGTTDLQITVEGATAMSQCSPYANLKIIEGMNHVLRQSTKEVTENMSTYSNSALPLHPDLVNTIKAFLAQ